MKISSETIGILQNFATINNGLQVKTGSELKTISPNKTILAKAAVTETFDDFCVYDLSQFLGTLSLFDDPDIEFNKDFATISDGNSRVKYVYADPNTIVTVPDRELSIDESIIVNLSQNDLNRVIKAANVLGLPNVVFTADDDGGNITVKATDIKNSSSNEIAVSLEDEDCILTPNHGFQMVFKIENLRIISDDYQVRIAQSGIAEFVGKTVEYFIAVEQADSKFN